MKDFKGFGAVHFSTGGYKTPDDYKKLVKKAHYGDEKAIKKMNKLMKKGDTNLSIALGDFQKDVYNRSSEMEGSTMIHEKNYVPMNCCLCGAPMPTIHHTHNPSPLTPRCYAKEALEDNLPHRCCGVCDQTKVIPQRMRDAGEDPSRMRLGTPKMVNIKDLNPDGKVSSKKKKK